VKGKTMDAIDIHEFVSKCLSVLDEREAEPEADHWFCGEGDDQGFSYCRDCIRVLRPGAALGEDYAYAYPEQEHDGACHCMNCGALLQYTLTDYGLDEELTNFSDPEADWDWNSPQDCYYLARMGHALHTDEQYRLFMTILRKGQNPPPEIEHQ